MSAVPTTSSYTPIVTPGTDGGGSSSPTISGSNSVTPGNTQTATPITSAVSGIGGTGSSGTGVLGSLGTTLGNMGNSVLSSITSNPLEAAALAAASVAAFSKPTDYSAPLQAAAQPALDAANKLYAQYASGQLNAADAASVAKYNTDQTAAMKDYYAKAGLSDSSMAQSSAQQIGQQTAAMQSQLSNAELQSALSATGVAVGPLEAAVTQQIATDQAQSTNQANFYAALAKMFNQTPASSTTVNVSGQPTGTGAGGTGLPTGATATVANGLKSVGVNPSGSITIPSGNVSVGIPSLGNLQSGGVNNTQTAGGTYNPTTGTYTNATTIDPITGLPASGTMPQAYNPATVQQTNAPLPSAYAPVNPVNSTIAGAINGSSVANGAYSSSPYYNSAQVIADQQAQATTAADALAQQQAADQAAIQAAIDAANNNQSGSYSG